MFYDISQYAIWILLALLIGCVVGWMTFSDHKRTGWFDGWAKWGAIAFIVGLIVAFLALLPGRIGHWLETALLLSVFYIAGCFLGGWFKALFSVREPVAVAAAAAPAVDIFAGDLASYKGVRPAAFAATKGVDDLTKINGVSTIDQKTLNDIGVYRYAHVAGWNADNSAWVDHHIAGAGRVESDGWVANAKRLAGVAGAGAAAVASRATPAARVVGDPATESRLGAGAASQSDADRLRAEESAAAQAEAARRAAAAAKAEADRKAAEAAAAAKAEADRKAAEAAAAAKAEADRKAAEAAAAAKAEADRKAAEEAKLSAGKPAGFAGPRGSADNLKLIKGIGPKNEQILNGLGVYHFSQIADWTPDNATWMGHHMAFPGRVEREHWIPQAKLLAAGVDTEHSAAVKSGAIRIDASHDAPLSDADARALANTPSLDDAKRAQAAAAAKAEADRRAAEVARIEAERRAAETAAAAKAEADRRAAEAARVEAERRAAEAAAVAARAEADRRAAEAARAEANRRAAEAAEAAKRASAASHPGQKPAALTSANGAGDNLKLIKGIGPKNEQTLHGLGVYHFSQIADWSPENAIWTGHHMAFPGRIEREHWIPQAKLLAAGVDTAHSAGVKSGAIKIDENSDAPLSEADAHAFGAGMPKLMEKVEGEDSHAGARPLGLADARGGKPDDLKLIKGIGKQNEARLHGLGVWHFDQIAAWSHENVKWVGSYLAFPGRIDREEWIKQAKDLASGVKTEFARRVEAGLVKTSIDDGTLGQGNVEKVEPHK